MHEKCNDVKMLIIFHVMQASRHPPGQPHPQHVRADLRAPAVIGRHHAVAGLQIARPAPEVLCHAGQHVAHITLQFRASAACKQNRTL